MQPQLLQDTGNCATFATNEVVSVTCTHKKGYTSAITSPVWRDFIGERDQPLFGCIAKIPQSPVESKGKVEFPKDR